MFLVLRDEKEKEEDKSRTLTQYEGMIEDKKIRKR